MNLGLVVIGDEILNGKTTDLNASWLTRKLSSTQIELIEVRFVRDKEDEMIQALKEVSFNNQIILTTGGIGPTEDDKTKSVMAKFFNKEIVSDSLAAETVSKNYERLGKERPSSKNTYNFIPKNFIATNNPKGLAPGLVYKTDKKIYMSAPGVPREFQAMFEEEFLPLIHSHFKTDKNETEIFNVRTFGIPEEKIFFELCPSLWDKLSEFGKVSSLPQIMGVDICLTLTKDKNIETVKEKIKKVIESTPLKDHVWNYGVETIPELIVKEAKEKNITISFAESCTGGLSSSRITDISGSSSVFQGSVVAYANEVKESLLKVKSETLSSYGAVSLETAKEMAKGVQKATNSTIGISYTGIAGPGGGSPEKPEGTVCIGYSFTQENKVQNYSELFNFHGDRLKLKQRFSERGLYNLLKIIRSF